ncbi:MAG: hypothetical protein BA066_06260 [Candidatus Korarchaeota archaeon NZ13-K]|nr:MAG: hypothetical protein BA066_06260 [Candidatus Korarchaeota archaeon NZ13-K]
MRNGRLESPYVSVRLLSSLKGFFTLKELESKLGIPYQVIWRYISLKNTPEKTTARKIIERIESLNLIEEALRRNLRLNEHNYIESWRFMNNYKFLDLMGYVISSFVGGEDVTLLLAHPQTSLPLALIASDWIDARALSCLESADLSIGPYLRGSYLSMERGRVVELYLPAQGVRQNDKVLLVKDVVKDLASLDAIMELMSASGARLWGVFSIISISDEWERKLDREGVQKRMAFYRMTR